MKIFFTRVEEWEYLHFEKLFPEVLKSGNFFREILSEKNISIVPKDTEILVIHRTCSVTKEIISSLPNLKLIITRSTGLDHIDTNFCREKNIGVKNIPNYSTESVAEYTVALVLMLLRNIQIHIEKRNDHNLVLQNGFELANKKVGIVGFGKIGQTVARILTGFNANIIFLDPTFEDASGRKKSSFAELAKESDILIFCCPLTKDTKHLLNVNNIDSLKKGCILVNTARGGILETEAIIAGINNDTILGVGLDVLEEEKEVLNNKNHDLWNTLLSHPQVVFTPHNAFLSRESAERLWLEVKNYTAEFYK